MCRSHDTRERSVKVGHPVLRLMGLQGAVDNGKDCCAASKLCVEIHLQTRGISAPSPCWFFFSLYFPGSLVSDKQDWYCYFQYTQREAPVPEEFLYNAIKAEDGRVYVGVPSQYLKSTLIASTERKQSDKVFRTSTPRFPNFHLHGRLWHYCHWHVLVWLALS